MDQFEDSLTVVNAGAEAARAAAWVERFAARAHLPDAITSKLLIVLDEMLSNVFTHALAGAVEGGRQIELGLRRGTARIELEVSDDGPEFDPTHFPVDSAARRITERRPGGVGLLFMRTLMDDVRFIREQGRNRIIMAVNLPVTD